MVEIGTVSEIAKISIRFSAAFAVLGIGLTYLYIGLTDASNPMKVLWAAGLSLGVAVAFLIMWTMSRDIIRDRDRERKRV
jgi:cytosine/uracil/thiamine/allantoin permease